MGSRHSSHAEDPALQKQIMALRFHEPAVSAHLTPGRNRYYRSPFGLSTVLLVPLPDIIGPDRVYSICMNEIISRPGANCRALLTIVSTAFQVYEYS